MGMCRDRKRAKKAPRKTRYKWASWLVVCLYTAQISRERDYNMTFQDMAVINNVIYKWGYVETENEPRKRPRKTGHYKVTSPSLSTLTCVDVAFFTKAPGLGDVNFGSHFSVRRCLNP